MKKLLLIALVAAGFAFAAAPRTEARTYFSVGIGLPIGFGYYGGCYPGYYSGYQGYYPYGYYRPYYRPYYSGVTIRYYNGRPFYWHRGHRVFVARRYR